jgi:hypothetical protein
LAGTDILLWQVIQQNGRLQYIFEVHLKKKFEGGKRIFGM